MSLLLVAQDAGSLKIHKLQRVYNGNYYCVWQMFVKQKVRSATFLHYSRRMHYEEIFFTQVCAMYKYLAIPRMHLHPADLQRGLGRSQLQLGVYQHWNMHLPPLSISTPIDNIAIVQAYQHIFCLCLCHYQT
jgi:hypothetical protein